MANFFQPSDQKTTVEKTASPAEAATTKFKAELLGRFLEAMGGNRPNFSEFVKGGSATKPFPTGFGGDVASLLEALNQPGAFTSQLSTNYNLGEPSAMSDLSSILGLGLGLNNLLGNPLGSIGGGAASFLGGLLGLNQPGSRLNPNDVPSAGAGSDITNVGTGGPTLDQILGQGMGGSPVFGNPGYGVLAPQSFSPQEDLANWSWSLA